jgi:hypothetical protein
MNYGIPLTVLACGITAVIAGNARYELRRARNRKRGSVLSGAGQRLTWLKRVK